MTEKELKETPRASDSAADAPETSATEKTPASGKSATDSPDVSLSKEEQSVTESAPAAAESVDSSAKDKVNAQDKLNDTSSEKADPEALKNVVLDEQKIEEEILKRPPTLIPDPADVDYNSPLIQCMCLLFRLHGKPISSNLIISNLAVESGEVHPSAVIRAARAAGLRATIVYRKNLNQISTLTLPCIILLSNQNACVLLSKDEHNAEVIFPESGMDIRSVPISELTEEYIGYAIYGRPEERLDRYVSNVKLLKVKRWFWGVLWHFLPIYKHVFLASIVINFMAIAGPLFFMNVYDRVVPNGAGAVDTLWVLAIGLVIAYLFDFLLRNLRSYFTDTAGRNADVILGSRLMNHLLSMRMDHKPESTGSMLNNLREFESLREFFSSTTLLAIVDIPFLFIFIVLIALIGNELAIIPGVMAPLVIIIGTLTQYPLQSVTERTFKESMQKNALLVEVLSGLETVKTSMAEGRVLKRWEEVVGMNSASNAHSKRLANLSITVSMLATQIVSVCTIIWGVYMINDGTLTMGGLIACNMLASRAMAPLAQVAAMLNRLQQSRMALKALDQLMQTPTERIESGNYVDYGHLEPTYTFEDVSFKYPNTERFALENVKLQIRPGEKVGIIGRIGSGKSTLGRLALGLYQPTEGAVKLGGVDIRQMDPSDLRSRVGYLSQDNYLFYGTVRDNIAFGSVNVEDHMILRAADVAGVTDFIRGHPSGFGMQVGERGMALSGGQRQTIALARALLHDPDILILDEPSSNMDNNAEFNLKRKLKTILANKTLIIITHRMSMVDLVDRIIVLDGGRILADGPKEAVFNALRGGGKPSPPARRPSGTSPEKPAEKVAPAGAAPR